MEEMKLKIAAERGLTDKIKIIRRHGKIKQRLTLCVNRCFVL